MLFSIGAIILFADQNVALAAENNNSKFKIQNDLYIKSDVPVQVPFDINVTDEFNNTIPVSCDKTSNSLFEIGKTTVRCIAIDSQGTEMRDSFEVTIGYNIVQIPEWLKQTTDLWLKGSITETEYVKSINYLLEKQLMHIPHMESSRDSTSSDIPIWINTNSEKWVNGEITDDEFSIAIQWVLDHK